MLDFSWKLSDSPDSIEEADREILRQNGFSDKDIWDIAAVASFYNMSNRMATALNLQPNPEYHSKAR
jgi:uncharacterized peroxidase-related enzyme